MGPLLRCAAIANCAQAAIAPFSNSHWASSNGDDEQRQHSDRRYRLATHGDRHAAPVFRETARLSPSALAVTRLSRSACPSTARRWTPSIRRVDARLGPSLPVVASGGVTPRKAQKETLMIRTRDAKIVADALHERYNPVRAIVLIARVLQKALFAGRADDVVFCVGSHLGGLLDSWCKSFPTTASCEHGADRRRRGHTWHA